MKAAVALLFAVIVHLTAIDAAILQDAKESDLEAIQRRQLTGTLSGRYKHGSGFGAKTGLNWKSPNNRWKANVNGIYSSKNGFGASAGTSWTSANNRWKANLNGRYSNKNGFGADAGISYTKGRFKAGVTGSYSNGGYRVRGGLSWRFKRQLTKREHIEVNCQKIILWKGLLFSIAYLTSGVHT